GADAAEDGGEGEGHEEPGRRDAGAAGDGVQHRQEHGDDGRVVDEGGEAGDGEDEPGLGGDGGPGGADEAGGDGGHRARLLHADGDDVEHRDGDDGRGGEAAGELGGGEDVGVGGLPDEHEEEAGADDDGVGAPAPGHERGDHREDDRSGDPGLPGHAAGPKGGSGEVQVLDGLEDEGMNAGGGADDAAVAFEAAAAGEVEVVAVDVGDEAAGLVGDGRAGGVVPDAFDVAGLGGEAEVDVGLAAGDDGVLGLGVHAEG